MRHGSHTVGAMFLKPAQRSTDIYGAVSFLAARRKALRPDPFITVTIGLGQRLGSPRIDAASEPYPGRWTHHLVIGSPDEIDDELAGWLREAAVFAAVK